jgi:hypothetical protein
VDDSSTRRSNLFEQRHHTCRPIPSTSWQDRAAVAVVREFGVGHRR